MHLDHSLFDGGEIYIFIFKTGNCKTLSNDLSKVNFFFNFLGANESSWDSPGKGRWWDRSIWYVYWINSTSIYWMPFTISAAITFIVEYVKNIKIGYSKILREINHS